VTSRISFHYGAAAVNGGPDRKVMKMRRLPSFGRRVLAAALGTALFACSDETQDPGTGDTPVDAGAMDTGSDRPDTGDSVPPDLGVGPDASPDAGMVDAGGPIFSCDAPITVAARLNEEVRVELDTSMATTRPRDLGYFCGNTDPEVPWVRQVVVAVELPGTDSVALHFDATADGTPESFDTVIQARSDCSQPPPLEDRNYPRMTCFDDTVAPDGSRERRSQGVVQGRGGDKVFLLVTGYGGLDDDEVIDEGPVELVLRAEPNLAPTLDAATVFVVGDDAVVRIAGDDPDANLRGAVLNFRVDGVILDIYNRGESDPTQSAFAFDRDDERTLRYLAQDGPPEIFFGPIPESGRGAMWVVRGESALNLGLGRFLDDLFGVEEVGIRVYDDAFLVTGEVRAPVVRGAPVVDRGGDCAMAPCDRQFDCVANVCQARPPAVATCEAAVDAGLSPAAGTFAGRTVELELASGPSTLTPPRCAPDDRRFSAEAVVRVTVPADGRFDVVASTDTARTGSLNTLLHGRTDCLDVGTEFACNDNIRITNSRSAVEVLDASPGEVLLVVQAVVSTEPSMPIPVGLDLALRPVLPLSSPCDPMGVQSRCGEGSCVEGGGGPVCTP
jgi:hypothetical protein